MEITLLYYMGMDKVEDKIKVKCLELLYHGW